MRPVGRRRPRDSGDVVLRAVGGRRAARGRRAGPVQARQGLDWARARGPGPRCAWVARRGRAGRRSLVLAGLAPALLRRCASSTARPGRAPMTTVRRASRSPLCLRFARGRPGRRRHRRALVRRRRGRRASGRVAVEPDPADPPTGRGVPGAGTGCPGRPCWPWRRCSPAVAAAGRLDAVRRNRDRRWPPPRSPPRTPSAEDLATAVAAAAGELDRPGTDARSAIIAAYAAMATSIEAGLARAGRPASRAGRDTPTELLDRAVSARAGRRRPGGHADRAVPRGPVQPAPDGRAARAEPPRPALAQVRGRADGARRG